MVDMDVSVSVTMDSPLPWNRGPSSGILSDVDDAVSSLLNFSPQKSQIMGTDNGDNENLHVEQLKIPKRSPLHNNCGSPQRLKRQKMHAPPSPAAAMLLNAAEALDSAIMPSPASLRTPRHSRMSTVMDGFGNALSPGMHGIHDSSDLFSGGILAPPSPAVTPSRLLFSPVSGTGSNLRPTTNSLTAPVPYGISPFAGGLNAMDPEASPNVGSIWKQPDSPDPRIKRDETSSTARRPLMELMTPSSNRSNDNEDPQPLPISTPNPSSSSKKTRDVSHTSSPVSSSNSDSAAEDDDKKDKTKKDRKTYSTAGRPRVRGEYKCGKCGFMPKKAKHDCEAERSKRLERGEEVPKKEKDADDSDSGNGGEQGDADSNEGSNKGSPDKPCVTNLELEMNGMEPSY